MSDATRFREEFEAHFEEFLREVRKRAWDEGAGVGYFLPELPGCGNYPKNPYAADRSES